MPSPSPFPFALPCLAILFLSTSDIVLNWIPDVHMQDRTSGTCISRRMTPSNEDMT
ncbi:hypothetical protein ASPZODRAFT_129625 [Penicilliopsis zonata CBS 506.65]|uniref:Ig-like domain-containing protein n=1 Tax=Penicilliopsis zonata CBS 506.65 TaxID=1073090 RepID=A0A1L9SPM7_9EURO|nr:hypothetical protein ASPZODRAFT_129625 [Penicilliopsis zonata CBS 506.65]OJJ49212.1 hypothetical protein ASPZODRAFT_129625 [Penicilliopsis zonata CBS 506.65]